MTKSDFWDDIELLDVSQKMVEFEDGETVEVEGFRISRESVKIKHFRAFAEETGYVCDAIRRQEPTTLYDNELINHLSDDAKLNQPAFCISRNDANEFCDWADGCLPTEAEWLAASVILWNGPNVDYDALMETNFEVRSDTIISRGYDWTSTPIDENNYVLRGGPLYYLHEDWRDADDRWFFLAESTHLFNTFKIKPQAR